MILIPECFLDCVQIGSCKGCKLKYSDAPCYDNKKRAHFIYDDY